MYAREASRQSKVQLNIQKLNFLILPNIRLKSCTKEYEAKFPANAKILTLQCTPHKPSKLLAGQQVPQS